MKNACPLATRNHLFAHQGHLPRALGAINPAAAPAKGQRT